MKKYNIKHYLKKRIPKFIMDYLSNLKKRKGINYEFANYILDAAFEFSKGRNGDTVNFDRRLKNRIIKSDNECNSVIQDILTAFMPNYEENLFQYYKNQEYLIFYRFLTYPFKSNLYTYILPYEKAISKLKKCDIIDYGAGIPFGLIHSLLNHKNSINSIALIDLDLVHVDFTEFLIRRISPDIKFTVYRLNDCDSFPKIEGKYNFFYGQDIFEHLNDPLKNLKELMSCSQPHSLCYFDFQDHGEKMYQHITPNVEFLSNEMVGIGFKSEGRLFGLSEFERNP